MEGSQNPKLRCSLRAGWCHIPLGLSPYYIESLLGRSSSGSSFTESAQGRGWCWGHFLREGLLQLLGWNLMLWVEVVVAVAAWCVRVCVCTCVLCVCVCVYVQGVLGEGEQSQPILERGNGASLVVLFSKRVYCWCGRKALNTAERGLDCLLPLVWCG